MSDTKLREKADALIAFTLQGPRFIAWVEAVTDSIAPAPEKAAKAATTADRIAADLAAGTFRGVKPAPVSSASTPPRKKNLPRSVSNSRGGGSCGSGIQAIPLRTSWGCSVSNEVGFITVTINGETRTYSMHESRPEPAAPVTGHTPIGEYDPDMKPAAPVTVGYQPIDRGEIKSPPQGGTGTVRPAAPEMPEILSAVMDHLYQAAEEFAHYDEGDRAERCNHLRAELKHWWRTHSQPVAHPFKAGFKPDSMRHFAEYVRDNWHYFGTDTAGLAHQFVQEMAAQPVAVGMTEELKRVLEFASLRARILRDSHQGDSVAFGERMIAAIAAVRQQAAQVKL